MSASKHLNIIKSLIILFLLMFMSSCAARYELSLETSAGGIISIAPSGGVYKEGERVTLTANRDSDYHFTGWRNISDYSLDSSLSSKIDIIMPAKNISISAGFIVPDEGWTFMIYMAGDNILSNQVYSDLMEIEKGLYEAIQAGNSQIERDVKVLVLTDRSGDSDSILYLAKPSSNTYNIASTRLDPDFIPASGELNMADPETLKDFVEYGLAVYPSVNNALILWNHGGGVKSLDTATPVSKEISEDNGELMYLNEVQTAVSTALGSKKLDIFGIDACIMGEVETAYEMRNIADYFVASAANELGYGWGYDHIFNNFNQPGQFPGPPVLADILVSQFKETAPFYNLNDPNTMVAVNTAGLEALKTEIDKLAKQIYSDYEADGAVKTAFEDSRDASVYYHSFDSTAEIRYIPYYDLYSFCEQLKASTSFSHSVKTQVDVVLAKLDAVVVAYYGDSSNFDASNESWPDLNLSVGTASADETDDASLRGLSIMIPHGEKFYNHGSVSEPDSRSYYYDIWWYGYSSYRTTVPDIKLGGIDFATYNGNGNVETWRELFEAWYDEAGYTPGTF